MTKSFDYSAPHFEGWEAETKVCPHCKQEIQTGESVHWWQGALWLHQTMPEPRMSP